MNVFAVAFVAWNSTNAPMITTVAVRLPDGRACEGRRDGQVLDRFSVEVGELVERKINVRGGGVVEIYLDAVDHTPDKEAVAASGLAILTPSGHTFAT